MQTNQHASHHPTRIRRKERAHDIGLHAISIEDASFSRYENSSSPSDVLARFVKPRPSRGPGPTDKNAPLYHRWRTNK
jgi:hypothetical protein